MLHHRAAITHHSIRIGCMIEGGKINEALDLKLGRGKLRFRFRLLIDCNLPFIIVRIGRNGSIRESRPPHLPTSISYHISIYHDIYFGLDESLCPARLSRCMHMAILLLL